MVIAIETLANLNAEELRAMVQSLLQTVTFKQAAIDKLTHENAILQPYAHLKDVLTRQPTHRASLIHQLLPHHWQPQS